MIDTEFYVQIIEDDTDIVVRQMGPASERQAEKLADGASINLNWDRFHVRIVPASERADVEDLR